MITFGMKDKIQIFRQSETITISDFYFAFYRFGKKNGFNQMNKNWVTVYGLAIANRKNILD